MYLKSTIFGLCIYVSVSSCKQPWIEPQPATCTSFVYAPGIMSSETLMGRYCSHFVASTGETVTCSKGIEVIKLPATSGNLAEISLKPTGKKKKKRFARTKTGHNNKSTIYNAPFRYFWYCVSYYFHRTHGITVHTKSCKHHLTLQVHWANPINVNLGQDEDIALFKTTYQEHIQQLDDSNSAQQHDIVLYGSSRGAATIFNFTALYQPKHVRALVCEGLYDSIAGVYAKTNSLFDKILITLLPKVTNFKHDGIAPIKLIDQIPKELPILLITSRNDRTVPWRCTMHVYRQLRAHGHPHVHILILKDAGHAWYPYHSKDERELYQNVVHAFYKQYGLPYIEEFAQAGKEYFENKTTPV